MKSKRIDLMAGRLAQVAADDPTQPRPITDPTAGESARAISERRPAGQTIKDPTDPRCGQSR